MELLGSFTVVNEYSCATYYVQILKYRHLAKKESFQAKMLHHLSTDIVLTHEVAGIGEE